MEPFVIRQGDSLVKLAYTLGFDADTVWNDDKNSDLRKLRPDPNVLLPSDVLYIPDQVNKAPDYTSIATGTTNSFVSDTPTATVTIQFLGESFASQPCSIAELEHLVDLATDGSGALTFSAPVTLDVATVTFSSIAFTCACRIGGLDPHDESSGALQRLTHLGYSQRIGLKQAYMVDDDGPQECEDAALVLALLAFQEEQQLPVTGTLDAATAEALKHAHGA